MNLLISALLILGVGLLPNAQASGTTTPTTSHVGTNMAMLNLQSSGSGTGYFTLLSGSYAACGSGAQVKAGQTSAGTTAPYHGSLPLVANTLGHYTVRNLTQSTAYTICFTAENPTGSNLQTTPSTANFSTLAPLASGNKWVTVGSAGFTAGSASSISFAFAPDATPYVAYRDQGLNASETVMKFDGTHWVIVGRAGFSAGTARDNSLAFAPDGTPYVAYKDEANGEKATVMKFDGTNWVTVGRAGFSTGSIGYNPSNVPWALAFSFAPDGTPYVAYQDGTVSDKATVMKFDGTNWVTVGSAGFSAGFAYYASLAFAQDGTPYVVYEDAGNNYRATVMKFDGANWVTVGSAGFSPLSAFFTSLVFAPDGTPYVAYEDNVNYRATVMKFDGTKWVAVGDAGFTVAIDHPSLAFAPNGTPYMAFADTRYGYDDTVMKFDGTNWVTVGNVGFSASDAGFTSLAFAPDGTPAVMYQDSGNDNKVTMMKLQSPACGNGVGLTVNPAPQWQTLAAPCTPNSPATVAGTFGRGNTGSLLGTHYASPSNGWTLYTRNAAAAGSSGTYVQSLISDVVAPGTGYWLKSLATPVGGGNLTITGTATPVDSGLAGCTSGLGCYAIKVGTVAGQNRYNLVGNPFPYSVAWAEVRVLVNGTVYTPGQAQAANIISNTIWIWNGNGYDSYSDTPPTDGNLEYFSSFWVNVLPGAAGKSVQLLIPSRAVVGEADLSLFGLLATNTVEITTAAGRNKPVLSKVERPAPAGVFGELASRMPETVAKRPYSGLHLRLLDPQQTGSVLKTESVLAATPWYSRLLDWVIPAAAADAATQPVEWTIRLNVDNPKTGWKDHNSVLGQLLAAKDGYDATDLVEMAPFASPYLTLVFPHPEWGGGKAGNYASDLRSASGLATVWNVDLQADPVGSQVVLTWQGDPAILARSQLTDLLTGKVINPADPQWAKGYPVTLSTSVRHFTWSYLGR